MDSYWNGNIKWFTPSEIGKSKYISDSERHITKEGLKNSSAKLLPKNTILLSSRATVGEASIALSVCTTNQGFQSLIINQNVDNEFIYYLISTIKNEFLRRSSGSTFLEISKNEIKKIKINIPSLEEQKQISKFFSSIDNKIKLLKEEYYKYSEFKRFLLNSIFSDSEDKLRFLGLKYIKGAILCCSDFNVFNNHILNKISLIIKLILNFIKIFIILYKLYLLFSY